MKSVVLRAYATARETKLPLAYGGLDSLVAAGSEQGLCVGKAKVRTLPLAPSCVSRAELAVCAVELGVVVR